MKHFLGRKLWTKTKIRLARISALAKEEIDVAVSGMENMSSHSKTPVTVR